MHGRQSVDLSRDGSGDHAIGDSGPEPYRFGGEARNGPGLATVPSATRLVGAIAVDDAFVYVGERAEGLGDGRILRVPIGGGELEPIITAHHVPFHMTVDDVAVLLDRQRRRGGPGRDLDP